MVYCKTYNVPETTMKTEKRLLLGPGEVRCACGALLFKAHGPVCLEMKCRRCGKVWVYATAGK